MKEKFPWVDFIIGVLVSILLMEVFYGHHSGENNVPFLYDVISSETETLPVIWEWDNPPIYP
jgi:hypothetical protein